MQSAPLSASLARKPTGACVDDTSLQPLALLGERAQLTDELRPARAPPLIARAATLARLGVRHADVAQLARRCGGQLNAAA